MSDTNSAIPTVPAKATQAQAEAATDDAAYMTALQVKNEVQKDGAVSIPSGNIASVPESKLSIADNTTANATTSAHGFLKKLSNVATEFMNGIGNWVAITIDGLLPSQTGNAGKFLTTNGASASWGAFSRTYTADYNVLIASLPTERSQLNSVYTKVKELIIDGAGVLNFSWSMRGDGGSTGYGRIYRNGVAVGTEKTVAADIYATVTDSVSGWSVGDKVQLYIKGQSGPDDCYIKDFKVFANSITINTD
jgi:hypothetical protein